LRRLLLLKKTERTKRKSREIVRRKLVAKLVNVIIESQEGVSADSETMRVWPDIGRRDDMSLIEESQCIVPYGNTFVVHGRRSYGNHVRIARCAYDIDTPRLQRIQAHSVGNADNTPWGAVESKDNDMITVQVLLGVGSRRIQRSATRDDRTG
jgi:hypothetical protein